MADGVAREGFDLDLAHGEARETAFVRALHNCTVEHKSDGWTRATGNIAVEIRQKGRPSGLSTTIAKFYAVEIQDDVWIVVRTALLREAVRVAHRQGKTRLIGDNNRYENVLVPVEWLYKGIPR